MKINYEEIIAKANARKDALQEIGTQLEELEIKGDMLMHCLEYFVRLGQIRSKLDAEGRQMLGAVDDLIYRVANDATNFSSKWFSYTDTYSGEFIRLTTALK